MANVYPLGGTGGIVSDLVDSDVEFRRSLKVSSASAFSAAGQSGKAFARTIPLSVPAGGVYSIKIQKNANVAVRFIRAKGLYIESVFGLVGGSILNTFDLLSTNGLIDTDFMGMIELYDGAATGDIVIGSHDELNDSIYPNGSFVAELRNDTAQTVDTFLTVGVQQLTKTEAFSMLLPDTELFPNTEMSQYNGVN